MEEKQLYRHFKRQTSENSQKKTWIWLRKGNLLKENESFLIVAQNNTITTNYIKAKIDKAEQNSKGRLCGDRDETIYHIISECIKLAQRQYKIGLVCWGLGHINLFRLFNAKSNFM